MRDLVVVGGGFAGMWAALGAAHEVIENDADIAITVVSKDAFLTLRPRLYERNPQTLRVPLMPCFTPLDIGFDEGTVTAIDTADRRITMARADGTSVDKGYDQLVLATGSALRDLPVPGLGQYGFNIDTYDGAVVLDNHLAAILKTPDAPGHGTFVIVGAGFTGIELAAEMRDRIAQYADAETADGARIILVEQADVVGPELGAGPRPVIEDALRQANVEVRRGMRIESVEADAATLDTGERLSTKTVVVTAGMQASPLAAMLPVERDDLGRVPTDEMLRVQGAAGVYVAGDIARAHVDDGVDDDAHVALMSCQHAMTMGKFAGYNAARALIGLPQQAYRQPRYVTCLDLGRAGAVFTTGWERTVEMQGTEAKNLKHQINTQRIYPPEAERAALLAAAHIDARPGR